MKPQNQVTVKSSETGDVFRCNRTFAERHDTLTILDDQPESAIAKDSIGEWDNVGGLIDGDLAEDGWSNFTINTPNQPAKSAGPIAAPVADDN